MGMKVTDLMSKTPISVESGSSVRDVVRMIFNLAIGAVLVVKKEKLVGIITEEDILHRLFPSIKEFIEDFPTTSSDEVMQNKFTDLLDQPVDTIMSKDPETVTPNTSLMRAQSKMLVNSFSHLPVVDNDGKLISVISQGDIFKALVGEDIPMDTEAQFYDWLAMHYDQMFEKM
ncbi:CBS domain-containing protein, partial [Candidatus Roizmanbacteria bacterium]|nr:CBS domain-containing protein [Candidatus Roizmanbacteria bacterium]